MEFVFISLNIFSDIDPRKLFFGDEPNAFLIEVLLRTFIMFLVILVGLRMLGKRSVAQLSVFELGVIIGLGSSAGDPMLYRDVGLLPSILAFIVILSLYRVITYLINYNDKAEEVLEGVPVYIAAEGKIKVEDFDKELMAHEEFFAQLRLRQVTHLGQLEFAILETNGSVSIIYYPDDEVKWGLPVLPHLSAAKSVQISKKGIYACAYCGHIEEIKTPLDELECKECKKNEWVAAINDTRIT